MRTLWSLQPTPAGRQVREWDGIDNFGHVLPPASYSFKIATAAIAHNIGTIGNTGLPTTTAGHVPINFESVAINPHGRIFTVHDWDEAHFDVIEWSPENGRSIANSGPGVAGLLYAVAADDEAVYATSYTDANNPKKAKFLIHKFNLTDAGIARGSFSTAGPAIKVYDRTAVYPGNVPPDDLGMMKVPLHSLAVHGQLLYCTDALAGLVRIYDKITGESKGEIRVKLPRAVAVAPDGTIWVAHEHHLVSAFDSGGTLIGTPISDASEIVGVACGSKSDLYVADRGVDAVRHYRVVGQKVELIGTLGAPAEPGDHAPDRFYRLRDVAVDGEGNVVTVQDEYFFNGGRIARFSPDGKALWEQIGLEFQSIGTYGADDPSTFYSMMHHAYRLDRAAGTAQYLGNTVDGATYRGGNISGVPRVVRLGAGDFYYMPTGDGIEIFRIEKGSRAGSGPVFHLAAIVGQNQPLPDGTNAPRGGEEYLYRWTWHDSAGNHKPEKSAINFALTPHAGGGYWQHGPMNVDADGNIWFVSYDLKGREGNTVYKIRLEGLDTLGNPIYNWRNARREVAIARVPWKVTLQTGVHASGGLTYLYGTAKYSSTAPMPKNMWMGGNLLFAYNGSHLKWMLPLSRLTVGLDVAPPSGPGGKAGVLTGGDPTRGGVCYYSSDGLLICKFSPSEAMGRTPNVPTGYLDSYSAIAANRDPRDGLLDVFVQDDFNDRILWYRVADQNLVVLTGPVSATQALSQPDAH